MSATACFCFDFVAHKCLTFQFNRYKTLPVCIFLIASILLLRDYFPFSDGMKSDEWQKQGAVIICVPDDLSCLSRNNDM